MMIINIVKAGMSISQPEILNVSFSAVRLSEMLSEDDTGRINPTTVNTITETIKAGMVVISMYLTCL